MAWIGKYIFRDYKQAIILNDELDLTNYCRPF